MVESKETFSEMGDHDNACVQVRCLTGHSHSELRLSRDLSPLDPQPEPGLDCTETCTLAYSDASYSPVTARHLGLLKDNKLLRVAAAQLGMPLDLEGGVL